jgi:hypothetical protein
MFITAEPEYGVYISLIRYSRVCAKYSDTRDRTKLLKNCMKFQHDLADRFQISISQIEMDIFSFM